MLRRSFGGLNLTSSQLNSRHARGADAIRYSVLRYSVLRYSSKHLLGPMGSLDLGVDFRGSTERSTTPRQLRWNGACTLTPRLKPLKRKEGAAYLSIQSQLTLLLPSLGIRPPTEELELLGFGEA
jgi:hypothetical protein